MSQPKLTDKEQQMINDVVSQLHGTNFQPKPEEEKPKEKTADENIIDEVMKSIMI
jgi:hypothetical protein